MVINSKEVLDNLLDSDQEARKEWEATFKLKNDPRITKLVASCDVRVLMSYHSYLMC